MTLTILTLIAFPSSANANHSWDGYHWARTSNPFTIKLGDNVAGIWDDMLVTASNDWSKSKVLDTQIVPGSVTNLKRCEAVLGRVEVCSDNYGGQQWLGVATIWITEGTHIVQGTVKNNDFYFGDSTYRYNNTAQMQHVICQEIGHTLDWTIRMSLASLWTSAWIIIIIQVTLIPRAPIRTGMIMRS